MCTYLYIRVQAYTPLEKGAQWLSGRVLDSRPKGRGFEPHRHHCVVSLSKNINPGLELVQPRKTRPFITERLLMGRKESKQTNKTSGKITDCLIYCILSNREVIKYHKFISVVVIEISVRCHKVMDQTQNPPQTMGATINTGSSKTEHRLRTDSRLSLSH